MSAATDTEEGFASTGNLFTLEVGGRALQFGQLVSGVVTLAVVLTAILYIVRPDRRPFTKEPDEVT